MAAIESSLSPRRAVLALTFAGLTLALAAAAPAPKPPAKPAAKQAAPAPAKPGAAPPAAKLNDRVLAVVDEDPILESDLNRVIALGLQAQNPGENETVFRKRVLNGLVEERLRFHEIDRFGFEQVPVSDIDSHVAEVRGRFKDDAAFQKALKDNGLTLKDLRQLVARQLMVLTYVDEQLGPRVFVTPDEVNGYYNKTLVPEMKKTNQPVPPVDDVRDQIREVLHQQHLNEAIAKWTEELRRKADIQVYADQPAGALPPVVKKIESPKKSGKP